MKGVRLLSGTAPLTLFMLVQTPLATPYKYPLLVAVKISHFRTLGFLYAKVHSMHLGPKISSVELAFPSAWRRGYCLNYNLWRTGAIKSKSPRTVLLIFAPQVYANLQLWRTHEMLLAYLRREVCTECALAYMF